MECADRFEFKFLLAASDSEAFFQAFGPSLQSDTQGGPSGVYPVVSLYYDSPDLDSYWDAWRKVPSRRKLRVRVYGSRDGLIPSAVFVEVKCKVDGRGIKHRLQTDLPSALAIASGASTPHSPTPSESLVLEHVHHLVHHERFQPRCIIRYRRRAFSLSPPCDGPPTEEPLRVTLDDQIHYRFDDLSPEPDDSRCRMALLPPDRGILEVKGAGSVPFSLASFLGKQGLHPVSFSKYCQSTAKHLAS
ncbi:MAG: hypothetical protein RLZZ399_3034 [Verrucomicrobiota bacterium]|jgi:hypothetical protein